MNKELFTIEGTICIPGTMHGRLMFSSARNVQAAKSEEKRMFSQAS